ncbi:uncharacterized protein LOC122616891 [Drosophila teissieri]|uniref:uncharacterized protein LOC122616891 n=1 Tax=Drosophila teissieri TaxID=7243 RepID=UPI001CBA0324|nr:uncharacterized protein LOC122616891 [Drosophila teissieri]
MSRQLSLLDLNVCCLACILSFLPAKDHLHLAHVCTHLRDVLIACGKSFYRRVELTGSWNELLLMREVGHLVQDLLVTYNQKTPHTDLLCKTIRWLVNLENVTLNLDEFPSFHSAETIILTLEKLPILRGIKVLQNNRLHNVHNRPRARVFIPSSTGIPESLLMILETCNPTIPTHDWSFICLESFLGDHQVILILTKDSVDAIDRAGGNLSLGLNCIHPMIYARGAVSDGNRIIPNLNTPK